MFALLPFLILLLCIGCKLLLAQLMYILNSSESSLDHTNFVHCVACFVHNPVLLCQGPWSYLTLFGWDWWSLFDHWQLDSCLLSIFALIHLNADAIHKTWNWIFVELLELAWLLLVCLCLRDHLYRIRYLPIHVKLNIIFILLLSKMLNMWITYSVIFFFFLIMIPLH